MSIEIKNVSFAVKNKVILNDVSIKINRGEVLCILGPSGSGKTTLLRNIIGELSPTFGEICIDKNSVPYKNMYADIGFMPQETALYEDISAYDNLLFFARIYGIKNMKGRIDELLEIIELKDHQDKLVINFSGGMKRRLSLAITFLHDPKFLILDEPTVGIDPVLREKIWQMIELKKSESYIVVTTHVMSDVERCDRVVILKNGSLSVEGKLSELKEKYRVNTAEDVFLMASK